MKKQVLALFLLMVTANGINAMEPAPPVPGRQFLTPPAVPGRAFEEILPAPQKGVVTTVISPPVPGRQFITPPPVPSREFEEKLPEAQRAINADPAREIAALKTKYKYSGRGVGEEYVLLNVLENLIMTKSQESLPAIDWFLAHEQISNNFLVKALKTAMIFDFYDAAELLLKYGAPIITDDIRRHAKLSDLFEKDGPYQKLLQKYEQIREQEEKEEQMRKEKLQEEKMNIEFQRLPAKSEIEKLLQFKRQ